jgi:hypothetical protein
MPIIQYRMNLPEVSDCPGLSRGTSSFSPAALVEIGPEICFGALICGFRLPFFLNVRVLTVSFMLPCRNVLWFVEYLTDFPQHAEPSCAKANRPSFEKVLQASSAL